MANYDDMMVVTKCCPADIAQDFYRALDALTVHVIIEEYFDKQSIFTSRADTLKWLLEQQLKKMPYQDYLKTAWWEELRHVAIEKANKKCQLCNESGRLDVHHRTYENRGREQSGDVIVLCRHCHAKFHNKLP